MTPLSHTGYTIALFFALLSLWYWTRRRRRISRSMKKAISDLSRD
jgi:uncharacterized protein (TIGR03382 family)